MSLKKFLKPDWRKLLTLFILEFFLTFITLLFGYNLPPWAVYLAAPNVLYLEKTIDPTLSIEVLSFHGSISDIVVLFYRYVLSCFIIVIYDKVKKR